MLPSLEPGRPDECPCFDLFRSGQVIACTKRRRACVLSRLSHLNRQTGLWRVRMLASGAPCAHQQSMCAAPNAGGIGTMKTSLRRLLVGALFAFVGALLIDGTAHAQAGCTGPDPFAALGGGTCYAGGWFPPGMPIPGGGASPAPVAGASGAVGLQRRRTRSRHSAAGPATRAAGSRRAWQSRAAEVRPPRCRRQRRLRPARRRTRSRRSAAGPATGAAGSRRAWRSRRRVRHLPAPAAPSACTTPDPFAALGGGTCYKGGWFPPGMPIPGGGGAHCRRQCAFGLHDAGPVRGARRRDLLQRRAGSRRACRSRAAEVRPRPNPRDLAEIPRGHA